MLARPKRISPRLLRWPRFALDETGLLPTDSCLAITEPATAQGRRRLRELIKSLEDRLGRSVERREVLVYTMAFLNSSASAFLLRVGREPTPKGSWNVNEDYLRLVGIAVPEKHAVEGILATVEECLAASRQGRAVVDFERRLDELVLDALGLSNTDAGQAIAAWAEEERP